MLYMELQREVEPCERKYDDEAAVEVCEMGRDMGEEMAESIVDAAGYSTDPDSIEFDDEVGLNFHKSMSSFTSSAEFANNVAPQIRSLAGKVDTGGKGTHTVIPEDKEAEVVERRESQLFDILREEAGSAHKRKTKQLVS